MFYELNEVYKVPQVSFSSNMYINQ
jgi:hypothetical protein